MSNDPLADRLPPQNRDAERGVIGGILRDPETLATVQQVIVADNFYFDAHQKIYQALCDLATDGQPIDLVILYDKLRKGKQLEDVGGRDYLVELWEAVPTGANAEYHAKLVRETAMVRGLIHASNEILRDSYDRTQSADELVAQAERKIMDIAKASMVGETKTLSEIVGEAFTRPRFAHRERQPVDQRPRVGLRRSGQHHRRATELRTRHRRRAAIRRKNGIRAEHGPQHRDGRDRERELAGGAVLQPRNGPHRVGRTSAVLSVARGQPQGAQGPPQLGRHPETDGRGRRTQEGAAVHRRHAEPHHDPDRREPPAG